jgi:hypothetical protein
MTESPEQRDPEPESETPPNEAPSENDPGMPMEPSVPAENDPEPDRAIGDPDKPDMD